MVLQCSEGVRTFHLFNCDKTCDLSQVKSLLDAVEKDVDFKIDAVEQHFPKHKMDTLIQRIPQLKMDYGVLVIHANDSLLFDENGYGEICKSMAQNSGSGQKLIIVICGDDNYQDKDEENGAAFSKWAWQKISTQCSKEYLERSQVFLLSWKDKHRQIHEDTLLHFLAPDKKAQVFVPQQKEQQKKHPVIQKGKAQPTEDSRTSDKDNATVQSGTSQSNAPDFAEGSKPKGLKRGTVLLSTVMRYGVISYKSEDVEIWEDDKKWRVSPKEALRVEKDWKTTPIARLKLVTDDNGVVKITVKNETGIVQQVLERCSIS